MSLWKFRSRHDPDAVSELQPQLLKLLIESGSVGPEHELLPPGWKTWLPVAEGRQLLEASGTAPSAPAARPAPPPPSVPRPRSPGATAPPLPPRPVTKPLCEADDRPHPAPPPIPLLITPDPTPAAPAPLKPRPEKKPAARVARLDHSSARSLEGTSQPVRRRRAPLVEADDEELEMTPMIDMTFLLLIFFMVTSTVSAMGKLELPASTSGDTEDPRDRVVLMLDFEDAARPPDDDRLVGSHDVDEQGVRMFLSDQTNKSISFAELEGVLKEQFSTRTTPKFVLQAHRRMPARLVRQAMSAAEKAGSVASIVGVSVVRGGP